MSALPVSLLAAQKLFNLLTVGNAVGEQLALLAQQANTSVPAIAPADVVLSSLSPDLGDKDLELTYPRICLFSSGLKNTQSEKFRSLSGAIAVVAEVWASGNMVTQSDIWIHYYVEALTDLLRQSIGDWGDGMFFSGLYDVIFSQPKSGGFGFVQSAKVTLSLNVSRN